MSRRIIIDKYEGNTHYSVHVIDSFDQEHYLGSYSELGQTPEYDSAQQEIEDKAERIWSNEIKREVSSLSKAIKECIEIDRKAGITSRNRDGLD